jgi:hypothetical protein
MNAGLRYVYTGNVHDPAGQSTHCHACGAVLIGRDWYDITAWHLAEDGRCVACESMKILRVLADVWLPDFKFGPGRCAMALAKAPWYWETVTRNIADSAAEIEAESAWVMDRLGPDVPLHFTAFHPDWKLMDSPPTPPQTVLTRNEQRGNLKPNIRLVLEVLERLEHGSEFARAKILIKPFGEAFEVDVGGIHVPKELDSRLRRDVTGTHRHRLDSAAATGLRHIDRIFEKDHGIVVSKRDGSATAAYCRFRNRRGGRHILNPIEIAGLRDVPVLAELAGQVAAGRAKR